MTVKMQHAGVGRGFVLTTIVVATLVATYVGVGAQNPADANKRVVRVTAERFAFTPSEITVPLGTTIEFHVTSEDTAHGFRVIGQTIDLTIPKRGRGEATATFTPAAAGSYTFECSRMCGAGHSFMRGVIRVKAAEGTP